MHHETESIFEESIQGEGLVIVEIPLQKTRSHCYYHSQLHHRHHWMIQPYYSIRQMYCLNPCYLAPELCYFEPELCYLNLKLLMDSLLVTGPRHLNCSYLYQQLTHQLVATKPRLPTQSKQSDNTSSCTLVWFHFDNVLLSKNKRFLYAKCYWHDSVCHKICFWRFYGSIVITSWLRFTGWLYFLSTNFVPFMIYFCYLCLHT